MKTLYLCVLGAEIQDGNDFVLRHLGVLPGILRAKANLRYHKAPGIAPELRNRILAAFRRDDVHGREAVALGVAMEAKAAKPLDAELTVESTLGTGSRFRLTLAVLTRASAEAFCEIWTLCQTHSRN